MNITIFILCAQLGRQGEVAFRNDAARLGVDKIFTVYPTVQTLFGLESDKVVS